MTTSENGFTRFLLSTRNLAGLGAAAVGGVAGAATLGITHAPVAAVALAAAGLYGAVVALVPDRSAGADDEPGETHKAWTVPDLRDQVASLRRRGAGLPAAAAAQLSEMLDDAGQILDRWDTVRRATSTAFEVESALTDYMPGVLDAYDRIPAELRDRAREGRQSPTASLTHQFGVLAGHLEQVRDAAYEDDIIALESHERFITTKYARSSLEL